MDEDSKLYPESGGKLNEEEFGLNKLQCLVTDFHNPKDNNDCNCKTDQTKEGCWLTSMWKWRQEEINLFK